MRSYLLSVAVLAITIAFSMWYTNSKEKKVRYVDLIKVYQAFELTNMYEEKLTSLNEEGQRRMDSLSYQISLLDQKKSTDELRFLQQAFLQTRHNYNSERERLSGEFDNAIWKQLNQYLEEFSKEKELDVLLGANGTGNVLSGNPELDVTEEAIEYVNEKFNGNIDG